MRYRPGRPSPSMIVALVALFVALGGSSYAAITITGKNIKNDSVTGKDVRNRTLGANELSRRAVSSLRGRRGATGPSGPTGAPGQTGLAGTARAYAAVDPSGPALVAARTKGFTAVARPVGEPNGVYCLTPPVGVVPASHPAIVSVDYGASAGNDLLAYWGGLGGPCPESQYEVQTFNFQGLPGPQQTNNVAFVIAVP